MKQRIIITINPRHEKVGLFVKSLEVLIRKFTRNGVILSVETQESK